ncbi:hypothetical protein K469DRAFT_769308 [Zopfia rhizophila CBS 207.26]|uniref:Uncharacterized protein n=1 Tax=Zopfia rhizophila CBS 207.26 TaxID=1314779 RepID=A0A6A6D647_9PEZI|nr:hypothetical protein K469DRAFT_769308 [Zopfia rhizophila CBS 207.26]
MGQPSGLTEQNSEEPLQASHVQNDTQTEQNKPSPPSEASSADQHSQGRVQASELQHGVKSQPQADQVPNGQECSRGLSSVDVSTASEEPQSSFDDDQALKDTPIQLSIRNPEDAHCTSQEARRDCPSPNMNKGFSQEEHHPSPDKEQPLEHQNEENVPSRQATAQVPAGSAALTASRLNTLQQEPHGRQPLRPQPYPMYNASSKVGALHDEVQALQKEIMKSNLDKDELIKALQAKEHGIDIMESIVKDRFHKAFLEYYAELFNSRIELNKQFENIEAWREELKQREAKGKILVDLLAEGHRAFVTGHVCRDISEAELEHARKEGELQLLANFQAWKLTQQAKDRELDAREEKLAFRERLYKDQVEGALKVRLREEITGEITEQIAQIKYDRGFQTGKEVGHAENVEEARQDGFFEGYREARLTHDRLAALRNGSLAPDSPELAFLYDLDHPQHPFKRGVQVGRVEKDHKVTPTRHIRETIFTQINGPVAKVNGQIVLANSNAGPSTPRTPQRPPQVKDFASCVDGHIFQDNGQAIQANGHPTPPDSQVTASRSPPDIYQGQRLLRYDSSDEEIVNGDRVERIIRRSGRTTTGTIASTPNLIDLY